MLTRKEKIMKKRLFLLIAIVAALMCLFAISASAVAIDGIEYTLDDSTKTATVDNNRTYSASTVVVIPQTVTNGDASYTVTAVANEAFRNNDTITTIVFPSTITVLNGYTFSECDSLTAVYIDLDNLTDIGNCGLTYNSKTTDSSLGSNTINFYAVAEYGKEEPTRTTSVNWANLQTLGVAACQGLNIETIVIGNNLSVFNKQLFRKSNIVNFTLNSNITSIGEWSFQSCTSLKKVTINSNALTTVGGNAFSACSNVEEFRIDLSKVTTVAGAAFCFSGSKETVNNTVQWYNLDGEKLVDISALEQITGMNAFAGSNLGSADTILWPVAYKAKTFGHTSDSGAFRRANIRGTVYIGVADGYSLTIDRWAFGNENYFDTVILGPNVIAAGNAFQDIATLKTVVLLADSFDITGTTFISNSASDVKLYCKQLTTNTDFSNSKKIQFTDYTFTNLGRCGICVVLTTADGEVAVNRLNHTEGSTNVVDATCTSPEGTAHICKYCANTISIDVTAPALGHSFTVLTDIVYTRFDADGYKVHNCDRDGCDESDSSVVAPAIFSHEGFSYRTANDGKGGISAGFAVNLTALKEYTDVNKDSTTVSLTLFIVNPEYLDKTGAFFNGSDVNAAKGLVQIDIQNIKYSSISCSISGFDMSNEAYTGLELVIGAYVTKTVTDGDNTTTTIEIIQKDYSEQESTPVKESYEFTDFTLYSVTVLTVQTPAPVEDTTA